LFFILSSLFHFCPYHRISYFTACKTGESIFFKTTTEMYQLIHMYILLKNIRRHHTLLLAAYSLGSFCVLLKQYSLCHFQMKKVFCKVEACSLSLSLMRSLQHACMRAVKTVLHVPC